MGAEQEPEADSESVNGAHTNGRSRGRVAEAVDALRTYIVEHGLQAGDRLPTERDFIISLGTSRSVIREALRELQAEHVVDTRHGHGIFVRPYGPELAAQELPPGADPANAKRQLLEARASIEDAAAVMACRYATAADLAALERIVVDMEMAARGEPRAAPRFNLDLSFHKTLVRSAHNPFLLRFSAVIAEHILLKSRDPDWRALADPDPGAHMARLAKQHRDLLEILRGRSPVDVSAAVRSHFFPELYGI